MRELPIITFDYEVELVDITVTTTHEVYVLVRRSLDQVHVLFNLEDAFVEPHILLGTMQALLIGNSLLLVDQGALWECELGTKNWGFVRKQREGDILANGVNRGPWGVMEDFRYAIINQNSVILESGNSLHTNLLCGALLYCPAEFLFWLVILYLLAVRNFVMPLRKLKRYTSEEKTFTS